MTPAARIAAAIGVLDRVLDGSPVDGALTDWGRASRYAGSGDRAAVRDLVFAAQRCRRSYAALGGAMTGRGLMIGHLRAAGVAPADLFTGTAHAPAPLTNKECTDPAPLTEGQRLDCPDWLMPRLKASLGADLVPVMTALQTRAPVFLRANLARTDREAAARALAEEGIATRPHPLSPTALEVVGNTRKIMESSAYLAGLVELQDAASQAVADAVPLFAGACVLDFCAGGGGKTLALAARESLRFVAHDHDPRRMHDLPERALRAGVNVEIVTDPSAVAPFDVVLADVPCSGSGSWRRDPSGKWALTEPRLAALCTLQAGILDRIAALLAPGGHIAYATCSLLREENEDQVQAFLARDGRWQELRAKRFLPVSGGDGFFVSILARI